MFFCSYRKFYSQWGYTVKIADASTRIIVNLDDLHLLIHCQVEIILFLELIKILLEFFLVLSVLLVFFPSFRRFVFCEIPENGVPYVQNDQTDSIFIAVSTLLAIMILDKEQRLYHFFRIDGYHASFG
jgi:hypothetical protein